MSRLRFAPLDIRMKPSIDDDRYKGSYGLRINYTNRKNSSLPILFRPKLLPYHDRSTPLITTYSLITTEVEGSLRLILLRSTQDNIYYPIEKDPDFSGSVLYGRLKNGFDLSSLPLLFLLSSGWASLNSSIFEESILNSTSISFLDPSL